MHIYAFLHKHLHFTGSKLKLLLCYVLCMYFTRVYICIVISVAGCCECTDIFVLRRLTSFEALKCEGFKTWNGCVLNVLCMAKDVCIFYFILLSRDFSICLNFFFFFSKYTTFLCYKHRNISAYVHISIYFLYFLFTIFSII